MRDAIGVFLCVVFGIAAYTPFVIGIGYVLWKLWEGAYDFMEDKAKELGLLKDNEWLSQKIADKMRGLLGVQNKQPVRKKEEEKEQMASPHQLNYEEEYWALNSYVYVKMKETNIFKLWKREQHKCQSGKCAICGHPLSDPQHTQVDHIKPRYKGGANYSYNLALVHMACNKNKGASSGYRRPSWIKFNKYSKAFNNKVYEITEEVRQDYPTKFPDSRFKKPNL